MFRKYSLFFFSYFRFPSCLPSYDNTNLGNAIISQTEDYVGVEPAGHGLQRGGCPREGHVRQHVRLAGGTGQLRRAGTYHHGTYNYNSSECPGFFSCQICKFLPQIRNNSKPNIMQPGANENSHYLWAHIDMLISLQNTGIDLVTR